MEHIIIPFVSIDSTQSWAKKNLPIFDLKKLSCVSAESQSAGRGRNANRWISPPGNIYTSFIFTVQNDHSIYPHLSQIFSLSCAKLLIKIGLLPSLKWPNDLLVDNKKIAGILTDIVGPAIILGIGINVNVDKEQLLLIDQQATSLFELTKKNWDCGELLLLLIEQIKEDILLLKEQGLSPFREDYHRLLMGEISSKHLL